MSPPGGTTLGQYQLHEEIGRGGMATVFRATQTSIGREVAVKILPREFMHERTFLERFTREVQIIAQLQHIHILPVYDFGEQDGIPYIVMAYMNSGTLSDLIRQGPLPLGEASRLVSQMASGLTHAHQAGIIHRDFKPSNVLIDKYANTFLTDFGIAKVSEDTAQITASGMMVGTPAYMAPEMFGGAELTPAVDIYALGITLYQMLSGQLPFQARSPIAYIRAHLDDPVPDIRQLRPDLPDAVQAVIESAMAKSRVQRYASAEDLAQSLASATTGDVSLSAPPVQAAPVQPGAPTPVAVRTPQAVTHPDAPIVEASQAQPDFHSETTTSSPSRPARRAVNLLLLGGGLLVGMAVAVTVGLLLFSGAIGGGSDPNIIGQPADEPPIKGPAPAGEASQEPVITELPIEESVAEPSAAATATSIPLGYSGNPLTANDEWTPIIQDFDGVEMAFVPVGCFMMGSVDGNDDEQPVHQQCFDEPFWIDVYEVTNAQYGSTGCPIWSSGGDQPRNCSTWLEAVAHCQSREARLPTEAEWEYAARGPDGLIYPWGNGFVADNTVYTGNTTGQLASVGSLTDGVSWVGANDLIGNVSELVSSIFTDYPYDAADGREASASSDSSSRRILRGGSFSHFDTNELRASYRSASTSPSSQVHFVGFRCARSF